MQDREVEGHEILKALQEFEDFVSEIEVQVMEGGGLEAAGTKRLIILLQKRIRVSPTTGSTFLIPDSECRSTALGSFPVSRNEKYKKTTQNLIRWQNSKSKKSPSIKTF